MSGVHPRETELACLDDEEATGGVAAHLRWCARCRSAVADYRWLQREIAATMALAADVVPVPRPKWWVLRERVFAGRRLQVTGRRASALASVMLAVCLMLSTPNVSSLAAVAQMEQPEVAMAPAPVPAVTSDQAVTVVVTPTPPILRVTTEPLPVVPPVLPPTPPEPES